jgi:hypothetical protein
MPNVKLSGPSMQERIANRLKNSGGGDADLIVQKGTGPSRTVTNIHHSRNTAHGNGGPAAPQSKG